MTGQRVTWGADEQGKLQLWLDENVQDSFGEEAMAVEVQRSLIDCIPAWAWEGYRGPSWRPQSSFVGQVVASEVDGWSPGQPVVGIGPAASRIQVAAQQIIPVHSGGFDGSALPYLGLCLRIMGALRQARLSLGEHVLVLGTGMVGQLAVQWARIAGAGRIVLTDRRKPNLVNRGVEFIPLENDRNDGGNEDGFDLLLDTSGGPGWIHDQSARLRRGGRVLLLANNYPRAEFDFYQPVHTRSLSVVGEKKWEAKDKTQGIAFVSHLLRTERLDVDALGVETLVPPSVWAKPRSPGVIVKWG